MANEHETHGQAVKRKYDELARSNDELAELYHLLGTVPQDRALQILQRIRSGETPSAVLRFVKHGNAGDLPSISVQCNLKQRLFLGLVQSTASLEELVAWLGPIINNWHTLNIPAGEAFRSMRHRIIKLDYLRHVLESQTHRPRPQLTEHAAPAGSARSVPDADRPIPFAPLHRVPASPWTVLTTDDEAISHLVSLFIVFLNDHWRHVEVDLFVESMRTGKLES